ncbi:allatostatin-A receptor-like, partial [Strongylocentrotus purpuratus]|uniref:G-protein coupled receptors family 1 profile domain-containing protein n=1 Tax=Strongylocentrotus purpuratus TaxID=7668 RepID=A0A7M7NCJ3_STRPU
RLQRFNHYWCASYEDGCPKEENSFISSAIDAVEGNGTSATKEGWVWSSITLTPWVILQMLVAIFGIIGNALVIVVLYQHRAANRVTDTLIANPAAADLLTSLFVIPLPMARQVPNTWEGQIYCKVDLSSVLMWANMSVST